MTDERAITPANRKGLTKTFVRRAAAVAFTVGVIAAATTGPAYAAVPTNDLFADRLAISTPFSAVVDTSEATSDAGDAELNAPCGAPATDASVWYEVTATTDRGMVIDVSGSSYTAGAIVATGGPGAWSLVGCAPGGFGWSTTAGTTYTILVFDDQFDGGGNGGMASITEQPWSTEIVAHNGKFAGGKAASVAFGYACGVFECSFDYEERIVQLSRAS